METKPTHEQAQLHLQIYEMRRETKLRQARDWFFMNYFVDNLDDAMRIAAPGTEAGAFTMMVFCYWEQACAFRNYGLRHEDQGDVIVAGSNVELSRSCLRFDTERRSVSDLGCRLSILPG